MTKCTAKASNTEAGGEQTTRTRLALNIALAEDGQAPPWVELLPPGQTVEGIDGRSWINDRPQEVLDYFARLKAHNRDLPIDWEHASEHKAPHGDPAPAAGWGTALEIRENGSIWARVEWTPRGLASVANREYRYLSPVLIYEKASRRIVGISSVGLTNKPNIKLHALNREGQANHETEDTMLKKILTKLALAETATEEEALNAIGKLQADLATANNRAETPSLDKFVPRPDYDAALAKAANAEQALAEAKKTDLEKAINAEIEAALLAGKITPATADFHKANCRQEGGLERFRDYVKVAPVVGDPSGLGGRDPNQDKRLALNADQARIAAMFGNSAEDLKKYAKYASA